MTCTACGAAGQRWGEKDGFLLQRCLACSTIFTHAPAGAAADLYTQYYSHANFEASPAALASLDRLVTSASPFRQSGRWLDMGYGEGALLARAASHGWACFGTEVSPESLEHGQGQEWTVSPDPRQDPRFVPATFDVVTMIEVLEHLAEPLAFVRDAAHWLRPGGLLYVTTPNARSLNARVLGVRWSVFCPPEHLTIWSAAGLGHVLTGEGFRCADVRTEGLNPIEILGRLRPKSGAPAMSRNEAAFRLNDFLTARPWRQAVKRAANHALTAFRLGDTLKIAAVRRVVGDS